MRINTGILRVFYQLASAGAIVCRYGWALMHAISRASSARTLCAPIIEAIASRAVGRAWTKRDLHGFFQRELGALAASYGLRSAREYAVSGCGRRHRHGGIDVACIADRGLIAAFAIDSSVKGRLLQKLVGASAVARFWVYYGRRGEERVLARVAEEDSAGEVCVVQLAPFQIVRTDQVCYTAGDAPAHDAQQRTRASSRAREGRMHEWHVVEQTIAQSRSEDAPAWSALQACSTVAIFTDGSAPLGNPAGPAGFAAVVVGWNASVDPATESLPDPTIRLDLAGHIPARVLAPQTSNNRAEIAGVLAALAALGALNPATPQRVVVYSDSQYAVKCGTGEWRRNANLDLWERLDALAKVLEQRNSGTWGLTWIKGHAGARWNEAADIQATKAALEFDEGRYAALRASQAATGRQVPSQPSVPLPESGLSATEWLAGHDYALVFHATLEGRGVPNVGRGPASGRYRLWTRTGRSRSERVAHPVAMGSAEAGYATLIAALIDVIGRIEQAHRSPAEYSIAVYSPDELVIKQLDGSYRVKAPNLQPVHAEASTLLHRFAKHGVALVAVHAATRAIRTQ